MGRLPDVTTEERLDYLISIRDMLGRFPVPLFEFYDDDVGIPIVVIPRQHQIDAIGRQRDFGLDRDPTSSGTSLRVSTRYTY